MFCKNCGAEIKEGGQFCPKCGSRIEESQSVEKQVDGVQEKVVGKQSSAAVILQNKKVVLGMTAVVAAVVVVLLLKAVFSPKDSEYARLTDANGDILSLDNESGVSPLAGAKLLKEQTKAQNMETLLGIINNDSLTEDVKQDAINSLTMLKETEQKELDIQLLLEANGYTQTVVSISGDMVDVMIAATNLTDEQESQILDIVQRKTDIAPENIIITVSGE